MTERIQWGILGTGRIAGKMAEALKRLPEAELAAVGSRTKEAAEAFGEQHGIPRRYASYENLAGDPNVRIIYVATPHNLHSENTILCLEHGKAVLCEKPFAVNARQAAEMIKMAREKRLFLMEAMWTRFLPLMTRFREILDGGAIGDVKMLCADFCFKSDWNPEGRLLNPNLAGGGLLDVGVYTVSFAHWVLGPPSRICSLAHIGETGVDEQNASVFGYDGGQLALLSSAVLTASPMEASVMGRNGMIRIHRPWWRPSEMTLTVEGREPELIEAPFGDNGFEYEAAEAMRCMREGKPESAIMSLDESAAVVRTMDAMREQWGLRYPFE